jgi:hypothetical protein
MVLGCAVSFRERKRCVLRPELGLLLIQSSGLYFYQSPSRCRNVRSRGRPSTMAKP